MLEFSLDVGPLPIPDDLTLVQFMLDVQHVNRPIRPANTPWLIEESSGRGIFLEEIRSKVYGLANALSFKYNIRENDVVCIFSPNHIDFAVATWATHRLGAVASCANPGYTVSELAYQLTASKSSLIITHPAALVTALQAAREAGVDQSRLVVLDVPEVKSSGKQDTLNALVNEGLQAPPSFVERKLAPGEAKKKIAFLSFSSGTTGRPKAVAIPHYAPMANIIQTMIHRKITVNSSEDPYITPGGSVLGGLPFFHIYGLVIVMHVSLFAGLSVLVVPKFNFNQMLENITRFKLAILYFVPPQVVLLCKSPIVQKYDFSHVRVVMSGAAPLTAELNEQLVKIFPNANVGQGYGMTETSTSLLWPVPNVKVSPFGSAGRLMPGVRVRILKEDGSECGFGERGELIAFSPSNALGYANNEEATKETFVDGWVRTGDEASIDKDYWVHIHDRLKELIKVRGFQVAPAELEGHLLTHPDVNDVCVVGVQDEYSGEVPLAFVALKEESRARVKSNPAAVAEIKASIAKHVTDHKVSYKRLAGGVEFVDIIPKNPSGKLLRRVLRDQARAAKAKADAATKARL